MSQETCRCCKKSQELFYKSCLCTEPICLFCLKRKIELKNIYMCEICDQVFKIKSEMNIHEISKKYLDELDEDINGTSKDFCFVSFIVTLYKNIKNVFCTYL